MKNNNSGKRYFEVSLPIPDHTPLVFILKPTNSFLRYTFSVTVRMLIGSALHQIPQAWGGGCVCVPNVNTDYLWAFPHKAILESSDSVYTDSYYITCQRRAEVRQRRPTRRPAWRLQRGSVGRQGAEPMKGPPPLPLLAEK